MAAERACLERERRRATEKARREADDRERLAADAKAGRGRLQQVQETAADQALLERRWLPLAEKALPLAGFALAYGRTLGTTWFQRSQQFLSR